MSGSFQFVKLSLLTVWPFLRTTFPNKWQKYYNMIKNWEKKCHRFQQTAFREASLPAIMNPNVRFGAFTCVWLSPTRLVSFQKPFGATKSEGMLASCGRTSVVWWYSNASAHWHCFILIPCYFIYVSTVLETTVSMSHEMMLWGPPLGPRPLVENSGSNIPVPTCLVIHQFSYKKYNKTTQNIIIWRWILSHTQTELKANSLCNMKY